MLAAADCGPLGPSTRLGGGQSERGGTSCSPARRWRACRSSRTRTKPSRSRRRGLG